MDDTPQPAIAKPLRETFAAAAQALRRKAGVTFMTRGDYVAQCLELASYGHFDFLPRLMKKYPDALATAKDGTGNTFLHWAVMHAKKEGIVSRKLLFQTMLETGALPIIDAQNDAGETPLMQAAQSGNLRCLRGLLKKGARIDVQDAEGRTALIHAIDIGDYSITYRLLDSGADIFLTDTSGRSAASMAKKSTDARIAGIVGKKADALISALTAAQKERAAQSAKLIHDGIPAAAITRIALRVKKPAKRNP
jgi:ankyrin repeat protein